MAYYKELMKFSYQARNKDGDIQMGFIEASSKEMALEVLQGYGLYVTVLLEVKDPFWRSRIRFLNEASRKDIVSFTRQLAIMLKSNIPLVESFETIARQTRKKGFQEKLLKIAESVGGGETISKSLAEFPKMFSPFFIGMLKSGEASGRIPESLDYLANYLEKQQNFKSQIIAGLAYPGFVLVVFFGIAVVMAIFVIPNFEQVFADMDMELPILTQIVLGSANFIKNWGILLALILAGLIGAAIYFFQDEENKKKMDKFILDLPFIGDLVSKMLLSRIALNLSTLIAGGVSISQSLEITSDLVANDVYKTIILKAREGVRAGRPISSVLAAYPKRFTFLFIQMITIGEKTGRLESSLQNVVDLYENEVNKSVETMTKLLEPILIIILGLTVALFALALFVPLFQQGMTI